MAPGPESVEPIPGEPAAVIDTPPGGGDFLGVTDTDGAGRIDGRPRKGERTLVVADYHAGIEAGLRREGVSLPNHAADRRERLAALLDDAGADRVLFLGDLAHSIGESRGAEREELEELFGTLSERASIVVVKGNHDGGIESVVEEGGFTEVSVTPTDGIRLGAVGFAHGHTWPAPSAVRAPTLCVAHEHPTVRLTDSVGGRRVERVWLRGALDRAPFDAHERDVPDTGTDDGASGHRTNERGRDDEANGRSELVVFPAFNDLVGGTWVNVPEQEFLSPFLPDGLSGGEAYLLDGTRLGDYRQV